jgi:hypothetical protein
MTNQAQRLTLGEVGVLPEGERALIKQWLEDNFCTEDTFECELQELDNGGYSLTDAMDSLGADDDAFGVHVLDRGADFPGFLVVLFEDLPQGMVIDRSTLEIVAAVIDGDIAEVRDGYRNQMSDIIDAVPQLR